MSANNQTEEETKPEPEGEAEKNQSQNRLLAMWIKLPPKGRMKVLGAVLAVFASLAVAVRSHAPYWCLFFVFISASVAALIVEIELQNLKVRHDLAKRWKWGLLVFILLSSALAALLIQPKKQESSSLTVNSTHGNSSPVINSGPGSVININYVSSTSPEGKVVAETLKDTLYKLRSELSHKYPYGCTLIGVHGQIFTTFDDIDNTNAVFRVDVPSIKLEVNKAKNIVLLNFSMKQIRQFSIPGIRIGDASHAIILGLSQTNSVHNITPIRGVGQVSGSSGHKPRLTDYCRWIRSHRQTFGL